MSDDGMLNQFLGSQVISKSCDECEDGIQFWSLQVETFLYGTGTEQTKLQANVPVWKCSNCGEAYVDGDSEQFRHEAVCRHLGRLTPAEIQQLREYRGLTQEALSDLTAFGTASIKRWETANQIQSSSADRMLRLMFDDEVFAKLVALKDQAQGQVISSKNMNVRVEAILYDRVARSAALVGVTVTSWTADALVAKLQAKRSVVIDGSTLRRVVRAREALVEREAVIRSEHVASGIQVLIDRTASTERDPHTDHLRVKAAQDERAGRRLVH